MLFLSVRRQRDKYKLRRTSLIPRFFFFWQNATNLLAMYNKNIPVTVGSMPQRGIEPTVARIPSEHHAIRPSMQLSSMIFISLEGKHVLTLYKLNKQVDEVPHWLPNLKMGSIKVTVCRNI